MAGLAYKVDLDKVSKDWREMEETIRANHKLKKPPYPLWMDLVVEEAVWDGENDKVYNLLLKQGGQVERWSTYHKRLTGVPWTTYFSEFQLYLWKMLDDETVELEYSWKYNNDMSFLSNFYNQCKLLAKNVYKREVLTNKAVANNNPVDFHERAEYTPDYQYSTPYTQKYKVEYEVQKVNVETLEVTTEIRTETVYTASAIKDRHKLAIAEMCNRGFKDEYREVELIAAIEAIEDSTDREILLGLATGQIEKSDIPAVLEWDLTANNRMKLSRYMKKLAKILYETGIVSPP